VLDDRREGVFADVGQTGSLDPSPEALHGIEFGCVGGKSDDLQSTLPLDELAHLLRAVRLKAVPDQHDLAAKVTEEVPEEDEDLRSADLTSVEAEQHSTVTIATIGQGSDR